MSQSWPNVGRVLVKLRTYIGLVNFTFYVRPSIAHSYALDISSFSET